MSTKDFSLLLKVLLLVMALALFSAGCGSSDPDDDEVSIPLPGGNSISMDKEGGGVKIAGEGGVFQVAASDSGVEYPPEMEGEFPVCDGCTPVQVTKIGGHLSVVLKSTGSIDDMGSFYLEKARAAGYTIGAESQDGGVRMFMAEMGEKNLTCTVGERDDGFVMINIKYFPGQ